MSTVAIDGVSKRYGSTAALDEVSITIGEGEFFALLGPSGSGKTTLLRAIAGFVTPDSGRILVDGRDVSGVPVHRRRLGMVFQHYALFPHLTVYENVAFGPVVTGTPRAEITARVRELLSLVQLDGLESRKPSQLSGGQQQRVALARALITRPRVLLLDEPLGALDKRLREQMQVELRQIQQAVGITAVFVTHDQEEALTLADRIALLDQGRLVQTGSPEAVYERPRTAFAAGFLGDANFFTARPGAEEGGRWRLTTEEGTAVYATDPPPGGDEVVRLAVRPEKLTLARTGDEDSRAVNRLTGTVDRVIYAGSSITYGVRCGERVVTVYQQNRHAKAYEVGESVVVSWEPEHTVVLS